MTRKSSGVTIPKHPVSERGAAKFHAITALVGLLHIALGVGSMWYHGTAAYRHWKDIGKDK